MATEIIAHPDMACNNYTVKIVETIKTFYFKVKDKETGKIKSIPCRRWSCMFRLIHQSGHETAIRFHVYRDMLKCRDYRDKRPVTYSGDYGIKEIARMLRVPVDGLRKMFPAYA